MWTKFKAWLSRAIHLAFHHRRHAVLSVPATSTLVYDERGSLLYKKYNSVVTIDQCRECGIDNSVTTEEDIVWISVPAVAQAALETSLTKEEILLIVGSNLSDELAHIVTDEKQRCALQLLLALQ